MIVPALIPELEIYESFDLGAVQAASSSTKPVQIACQMYFPDHVPMYFDPLISNVGTLCTLLSLNFFESASTTSVSMLIQTIYL